MRIIPNVSAEAFTFSAIIIGFLLIDDTTATEQNALGNWLMLIAQVLCTNAFYQQLQIERNGGVTNTATPNTKETIEIMQKMMKAMQQEINELKKQL